MGTWSSISSPNSLLPQDTRLDWLLRTILEWGKGSSSCHRSFPPRLPGAVVNIPKTHFCSGFSETVTYCTAGMVPPAPPPPLLVEAGVTWLALRWSPPSGVSSEDALTYTLDVEEEGSVSAPFFHIYRSSMRGWAWINISSSIWLPNWQALHAFMKQRWSSSYNNVNNEKQSVC